MEEKTMKKRSLFAAVAMLIVSAIVLTSATYAWFATGGAATQVGTITGNVAQASAGIRLRTQSSSGSGASGWQDALDYKMLAKDTTYNSFATNYTTTGDMSTTGWEFINPSEVTNAETQVFGVYEPVSSADPRANTSAAPTIFAYSLANNIFGAIDSSKNISDFYDEYSFYVGTLSEDDDPTTNDTDVNMKIQIAGTAAPAARVAVYTYAAGAWTFKGIYSGAGESGWKAITADLPANTRDANGNFIVDDAESSASITATTATSAGGSGATILLPAVHQTDGYTPPATESNPSPTTQANTLVKCFVWLEGNDADCKPTTRNLPGGDIQVTYTFTMATP